jgi:hypothetical protein
MRGSCLCGEVSKAAGICSGSTEGISAQRLFVSTSACGHSAASNCGLQIGGGRRGLQLLWEYTAELAQHLSRHPIGTGSDPSLVARSVVRSLALF